MTQYRVGGPSPAQPFTSGVGTRAWYHALHVEDTGEGWKGEEHRGYVDVQVVSISNESCAQHGSHLSGGAAAMAVRRARAEVRRPTDSAYDVTPSS